jgi:hypothetical protein
MARLRQCQVGGKPPRHRLFPAYGRVPSAKLQCPAFTTCRLLRAVRKARSEPGIHREHTVGCEVIALRLQDDTHWMINTR